MHEVKTIGMRELVKLLKGCEFLQGYWAKEETADFKRCGFQLICGYRKVLKADGGDKVGERTEWHTITIGDLPSQNPATYLHASYGEARAIKVLFLAECEKAKKEKRDPRMFASRSFWGHEGDRPCTYYIAKSNDGNVGDHSGPCYTVHFGGNDSCYLTIAGGVFDPAGRLGNTPSWMTPDARMRDDATMGRYFYRLDMSADQKTSEESAA